MDCFRRGHFPLGKAGVCQADYFTSAYQVIPDWLKVTFLREPETSFRLSVKSQFGDVALAHFGPVVSFSTRECRL